MSCHYSCQTCSSNIYMYTCLTCPSTRRLVSSTCQCQSGYYEGQVKSCYPSSQASIFTQLILPFADGLFYTNIALFWLYTIMIFCRVNSQKIRIIINFGQTYALLLSYPFLFDKLSYSFLQTLIPLNFSYFTSIYQCSTTLCTILSYIWQPLLVLPCLIGSFLISYFLMSVCYRSSLQDGIKFSMYVKNGWFFIIFCFLDFTAVRYGENLGKMVRMGVWGWGAVGAYFVIVGIVGWKFFRVVNSTQQSKIVYRGRHNWAYGYDQNYHLHYIDFLYTSARQKDPDPQSQLQPQTLLQSTKKILPQPHPSSSSSINLFIPHSNLYLCQLLFKFTLGLTTQTLYTSNPTFILYSLTLLLLIFMFWLNTFFYYDKSTLILYICMGVGLLVFASVYWMSFFWIAAIFIGFFVTGGVGVCFIVLFFVNGKIKDRLVQKMFQEEEDMDNRRVTDIQENSQQFMNIKNLDQKQAQIKPQTSILEPVQPAKQTKLQPFMGNLTRKTRPKPPTQTQQLKSNQTSDILRPPSPQQNPKQKKNKQIFTMSDNIKQNQQQQQQQKGNSSQGEQLSPKQNVIKHSKYQSKMNQIRTKINAKNRTKNVFEDLVDGEGKGGTNGGGDGWVGRKDNGQEDGNGGKQGSTARDIEKARATSKSATDKTKKENKARITQDQDFLSNVLQQPQQQQPKQSQKPKKSNSANKL